MNRRGFLSNTARLGTGSLIALCAPLQALALCDETRRLRWYASHCVDCGIPFTGDKLVTEYVRNGGRHWCRFCAEYGSGEQYAVYGRNPPDDYGPRREWR